MKMSTIQQLLKIKCQNRQNIFFFSHKKIKRILTVTQTSIKRFKKKKKCQNSQNCRMEQKSLNLSKPRRTARKYFKGIIRFAINKTGAVYCFA